MRDGTPIVGFPRPMNQPVEPQPGPAFFADPYPTYRRLLSRPGPTWSEAERTWLVARHDQATVVLKDPRFSKALPPEDASPLSNTMLFRDPPDHRRLRETVGAAFTPRRIRSLTERIGTVADRLIDSFEGRRRVDFIAEFAMPLPVSLIAGMLGVPGGHARQMCDWTRALVRAGSVVENEPAVMQEAGAAVAAMSAFFSERIADERARPGDTLLAELIAATPGGRPLTAEELLGTCMLIMIAGHETTVNLLGNGLRLLLTHPGELESLRREPGLMPSAIEEMLRFESPVQRGTFRRTVEPVELGGTVIPAGERVAAIIGAANRDPAVFADPDRFDIRRQPNPHLAFGHGIHYCLGAALARDEAAVAFSKLLTRLPGLRLAPAASAASAGPRWLRWLRGPLADSLATPSWIQSTMVRGMHELPVEW